MDSSPYARVCRGEIYVLLDRHTPGFVGPARGIAEHNFLECMQELHQIGLLTPRFLRSLAILDGTGCKCASLGLKIDLGVYVCCVQRYMAQPATDRVDIDARAKQVRGSRVPAMF